MAIDKRAFTLIELLVVITIIAVMVVVMFVAMNPQTQLKKARDNNRKTDLNQIKKALYLYYNDHQGAFPDSLQFGEEFSSGEMVYMKQVPADPSYFYAPAGSNNQEFCLRAKLEIGAGVDPDGGESKSRCVPPCVEQLCPGSNCNYYYVCSD